MGIIADYFIGRELRKMKEESTSDEVQFLPTEQQGQRLLSRDPTTMKFAMEGYTLNSILFECVGLRVDAIQSAPLKVYSAKNPKDEIPDCHLAHILHSPNPALDQAMMLQYLEVYLDIGGNMYMHKIRDGYGMLREFYPYHASQITPIIGDGKWITEYRYDNWGGFTLDLPKEDVVHFRWSSNDFRKTWMAISPVMSILGEIDLDNESKNIEIATLLNGAVIPFAIIPGAEINGGKPLTDQQIRTQLEKLRTRYGGKNRGSGMILNPGTDIKQVGISPKDFGNLTSRQIPETRIPAALKVPLSLTGLWASIKASAYNNHATDVQTFARTTVSHMNKVGQTFTHGIQNETFEDGKGSDFIIRFDTKHIPALQDVEWQKRKQVALDYTSGILMLDEARNDIGLPPDTTGKGGKYVYENSPVTIKPASITEG